MKRGGKEGREEGGERGERNRERKLMEGTEVREDVAENVKRREAV